MLLTIYMRDSDGKNGSCILLTVILGCGRIKNEVDLWKFISWKGP